jgi:hypothetical protein
LWAVLMLLMAFQGGCSRLFRDVQESAVSEKIRWAVVGCLRLGGENRRGSDRLMTQGTRPCFASRRVTPPARQTNDQTEVSLGPTRV